MLGGFHRILDLAKDLRFAEHHRIQPAGHTECMGDRALMRQGVYERLQGLGLQVMEARQPVDRPARFRRVAIDLCAITGRDDRRFPHRFPADQIVQGILQIFGVKGHLLADREWGRMVVHAKGKKLHRVLKGAEGHKPWRGIGL